MTVLEQVGAARDRLVLAGIDRREAALDAELLARHALGWDRATYLCRRREPAPAPFEQRYETLVSRRVRREPMAMVTGHREFWGLAFEVTPAVLTPRPETELIVEEALAVVAGRRMDSVQLVDVGTGSGCLAVALARELPQARVTAIDVSAAALEVARRNAGTHGVADRIAWIESSCLEGLTDDGAPADLIVANLPYVPTAATSVLTPEVRDHEPLIALDGGCDGLDPVRALVAQAPAHLAAGGHLIIEFGAGQEDAVRALIADTSGLALVKVVGDLEGIPRTAVIKSVDSINA